MKTKKKLQLILVSAALMACSFVTTATPTITPTVIQPTSTAAISPTPAFTATPFYVVEVGSFTKIKSGGFSFLQIQGYKMLKNGNIGAYGTSADKQVEIFIIAYPRPEGSTLGVLVDEWQQGLQEDFDRVEFTDPVIGKQGDLESVSVDFTGVEKDVPLEGRLATYEPEKGKIIYLYVIAFGDQRWQREGQRVFERMSSSLKSFQIVAADECRVARNPDYGYKQSNPIKIGGGKDEGEFRMREYLGVLLGAKGEMVNYSRYKPEEYQGKTLEVYMLRIGNSYKKIFFDTSGYEEISAPFTFLCSAPLPEKPTGGGSTSG